MLAATAVPASADDVAELCVGAAAATHVSLLPASIRFADALWDVACAEPAPTAPWPLRSEGALHVALCAGMDVMKVGQGVAFLKALELPDLVEACRVM